MIMLLDYWTEHPPIHEMAASYLYGLGHRSSKKRTAQHNVKTDDPAFNAPFLSLFKGGVLRG